MPDPSLWRNADNRLSSISGSPSPLDEGYDVENLDVSEDVTGIVENAILDFEEENGYSPDIDFSDIGWMFAGTWVEEYKDEINEW